jgi:cell division protein FtsL
MHLKWTIPVSSILAYIPLLTTMVTTILSIVLARATLRYAKTTDKSLALAREEFEREWSPELHIKLERTPSGDAKIIVTNLAKISVLLQMVQLRKLALAVPSLRCLLNEPLIGGMTWTDSIQKRLIAATGDEFQGGIAVSATFFASGRLFRTDWFRFQVEVKNGEIARIDPVNMAARRVKVVEPKNGEPAVKRELVRDVTATPSEEGATVAVQQ